MVVPELPAPRVLDKGLQETWVVTTGVTGTEEGQLATFPGGWGSVQKKHQ
jgi:hypothetical protein